MSATRAGRAWCDAALEAGATIVNDVHAFGADARLAGAVARAGAHAILVQGRGGVGAPPVPDDPAALTEDERQAWDRAAADAVGAALEAHVASAMADGVPRERLIVDPGIGFGKRPERSLALLRHLDRIAQRPLLAGLPLLVGTSRKGFIGHVLGLPVAQRLEGTLATLALAVARGADVVRVHDVRAAVRCCRMADAVVRG